MRIMEFKNEFTMGTIICVYSETKKEYYKLIGKEINIKTNRYKNFNSDFRIVGRQNNYENKYHL